MSLNVFFQTGDAINQQGDIQFNSGDSLINSAGVSIKGGETSVSASHNVFIGSGAQNSASITSTDSNLHINK